MHWSGSSLGYGYLFYHTADQAQAAKEMFTGRLYPDSGNSLRINYILRRPQENAYLEVVE